MQSQSSPPSDYEKCRQASIAAIMKKFESGGLYIRGRKVRNPKQALVIALKIADNKCKERLMEPDALKIADKIREFLDARDIKRVRYADLHRIVIILEELPERYREELSIKVLRKLQRLMKQNVEISKKGLEEFRLVMLSSAAAKSND